MEKQQIQVATAQRDIKWADGFRGLAALLVVSSHLTLTFFPAALPPSSSKSALPSWYQLPYLRLLFTEGFPWVAVFFLLTGFVNALGPIKKARSSRPETALASLSSSTFRRVFRLVLPCTIMTVVSWAICQFDGYEMGRISSSEWIRNTSPMKSANFLAAVRALAKWIFKTWAHGENTYDKNQWTMIWFLKGSMMLFLILLALVRATPSWRVGVLAGLYIWAFIKKDSMIGLPIYAGALLAEASLHPRIVAFAASRTVASRIIPVALLLLGGFLTSYPYKNADWSPWSHFLKDLATNLFPKGASPRNFWCAIGVQLIALSILLSASFQRILSHPILVWLGGISFPIYLIHGPLLRSCFQWFLFAGIAPQKFSEKNDKGEMKEWERLPAAEGWKLAIGLPLFFAVLLLLAHVWTVKVEAWCARVTKWAEERMVGKTSQADEKREQSPLLLPLSNPGSVAGSSGRPSDEIGAVQVYEYRDARSLV
ncbi:hypothetical protein K402DRAFT_398040 [Aulographum hederae CBS 113979]|uniref:Acyltransferase 3 domain-containing protein n=1 Tax=Aulographum hederae CBS 113979 TaxID=1176131 RepID=A0A6G1GME5_9PEZI|nr:hypothetical protein K402DRAFT_398040 [Aulographum hederae CBS 113979]